MADCVLVKPITSVYTYVHVKFSMFIPYSTNLGLVSQLLKLLQYPLVKYLCSDVIFQKFVIQMMR